MFRKYPYINECAKTLQNVQEDTIVNDIVTRPRIYVAFESG
jgi:hypothetical protein